MSRRENEKTKDLAITIFPHSYLGEPIKNRVLSFFGSVTLCQPWYMEPVATSKNDYDLIKIVRPPEDLKPQENFRSLLSEYRLWIRQNPGKGVAASLTAIANEERSWEIRQAIRQVGEDVMPSAEANTLKWHLILHLERELEENQEAADEMLLRVKERKSPLEEAIGEAAPSQGLFQDVSLSESRPSSEGRRLRQVLEAWFGLFGSSLPESGILLTLSPHVLEYATGLFEDEAVQQSEEGFRPFSPIANSNRITMTQLHLPRLSDNSDSQKGQVLSGLCNKTIILLRA